MKICLLIEDNPEDQQFFLDAVERTSSEIACYAVSDAQEALSLLSSNEVRPDCIFTDLEMPEMSGQQFLQTIKQVPDLRAIPVVVYSSMVTDQLSYKLLKLGAVAAYNKTTFASLKQLLRKHLLNS